MTELGRIQSVSLGEIQSVHLGGIQSVSLGGIRSVSSFQDSFIRISNEEHQADTHTHIYSIY
jgi:hypothetical protein